MTKSAFSGHCERFEESRGNLKTSLLDFGNRPESGNPVGLLNHGSLDTCAHLAGQVQARACITTTVCDIIMAEKRTSDIHHL
jgi:hypothetical protein